MQVNLGGTSTKALDELFTEAIAYFERTAEVHASFNRPGEAETIHWYLEVIQERVRRLSNTVKALMPHDDRS